MKVGTGSGTYSVITLFDNYFSIVSIFRNASKEMNHQNKRIMGIGESMYDFSQLDV